MFCPQCGTKLAEGARFCYRCGCRLADFIPELEAGAEAPAPPEERQPRPAAERVEPEEGPQPGLAAEPVQAEEEPPPVPAEERVEPEEEPQPSPAPEPAPTEEEPISPQAPPERYMPVILVDESHKERTGQENWAEFRARLKEQGKVSVRAKKPVSTALLRRKDLLVIGGPEHPWVFGRGADRWDEKEVEAIRQFVAQGGGLFMMGDEMGSAEIMSAVTAPYGISFSPDDVGDATISGNEISAHPLTEGVRGIRLGSVLSIGGNYLQVAEPAIVLAHYQGRPVLAYREYEKGQVVVLSSLSAFSGNYIDRASNSVLLENILHHLLRPHPAGEERRAPVRAAPRRTRPKARAKSARKKRPKTQQSVADELEPAPAEPDEQKPSAAQGLAARLARAREMVTPLQETVTARAREAAASVQETVAAKAEELAGPEQESLVSRAKEMVASVQETIADTAREAAAVTDEAIAPEEEEVAAPSEEVVTAAAKPGVVEPGRTTRERELWVNLFGEEDTQIHFDFAEHLQHFAQGLPPLAWEEGAVEHVRSLRKPEDEPWTFDLPFTAAEPWSPANYLRRLLYHLTHGRIAYFIDAETKRRRGGYYRFATIPAAANMNQQRFEVRHPITLTDESFLGEWPAAVPTALSSAAGGVYLTTHRFLFVADQAWLHRDEDRTAPLPFLSYWSKVDFATVLRALGEQGIALLVEKRRGPLPNRLAPRMWFEPIESWREQSNLEIITITGWETALVFVEGSRRGDGLREPSRDQSWAFFGYQVTKPNGRREFVAMIPHFIVPGGRQVKKGTEGDFKFLQSQTITIDALDLIAFAKTARDNELLHHADMVGWPVPLQQAPYAI
jgi:hypothetical protein